MSKAFFRIILVVYLLSSLAVAATLHTGVAERVFAQGGTTDFLTSCPPGNVSAECNPPTFRQLEFTLVRLIYALWGFSGVIFLALMLYNGYLYMFSGGDEEKIREAQKRMVQWLVGIFLIFLSVPIVSTVMKIFIGDGICYGQLQDPGFTFFFYDVCTSGDAPLPSPTI